MTITNVIDASQLNVIANKLADMYKLQTLMISNEEKLMQASVGNTEVTSRLNTMLSDDRV